MVVVVVPGEVGPLRRRRRWTARTTAEALSLLRSLVSYDPGLPRQLASGLARARIATGVSRDALLEVAARAVVAEKLWLIEPEAVASGVHWDEASIESELQAQVEARRPIEEPDGIEVHVELEESIEDGAMEVVAELEEEEGDGAMVIEEELTEEQGDEAMEVAFSLEEEHGDESAMVSSTLDDEETLAGAEMTGVVEEEEGDQVEWEAEVAETAPSVGEAPAHDGTAQNPRAA